jgi:tungstate transport system ATP-binding protein
MGPVLEVCDVRVARGGRTVLDVPALDVADGEVLALIGPNGAGKSTLLRLLGLLEAPSAGEIRFRGAAVTPRAGLAVRRRMASVFQDALLADTTVRKNVALGLHFRGANDRASAGPVATWLARFGIAHLADRRARTLSGGEAQRTALARALVVEPEVLLLDEPFAALDPPTREQLIDDLGRILREERTTAVLVTHDRGEAMALGDRVGVLMDGRLLQVDQAAVVFRAPATEAIARFVGVETILDCRVVAGTGEAAILDASGQRIEVAQSAVSGERVRLCLRAEDVTLFPGSPKAGASPVFNRLAGRVQRIAPAGAHVRITVDCGFPLVALMTRRSIEDMQLEDGAPVTAHFKPTAPHLVRRAR